jgi:hypothetical protein
MTPTDQSIGVGPRAKQLGISRMFIRTSPLLKRLVEHHVTVQVPPGGLDAKLGSQICGFR